METPKSVDLTNVSFDEFVAFLFDHDIDHEIPPESEKYDPWYFHVEVEFDAKNIGAYYVRMFEQPEFLLTRFTKAQLEEGFWAIQGPNLNAWQEVASMRSKMRTRKTNRHKIMLGLPDPGHVKSAVIASLRSLESQRSYRRSIQDFVSWCCSEPDFRSTKRWSPATGFISRISCSHRAPSTYGWRQ